MERSSKRGKIPQQDWPAIMARYEAGETLASIAKTYDCSPPAISYIVSRSRARGVAPAVVGSRTPPSSELQLVKSHAIEMSPSELAGGGRTAEERPAGNLPSEPPHQGEEPANEASRLLPDRTAPAPNIQDSASLGDGGGPSERYHSGRDNGDEEKDGNTAGSFAPGAAPPENHRSPRTLHLSQPARDEASHPQPHRARSANPAGERIATELSGAHQEFGQADRQGDSRYPPAGNGAGAFIDLALRQRVEVDIATFLAAFDAALTRDTSETRAELREATDRLLRAGARTRIELERLEARVPLSSRSNDRQPEPGWRHR